MPKLDGKHWGSWYYAPGNRTLVLSPNPSDTHAIYLDELQDSASILDAILQVSEKTWATAEQVGNLVRALDDLGDGLQGKVCPFGKNKQFDMRAHLS